MSKALWGTAKNAALCCLGLVWFGLSAVPVFGGWNVGKWMGLPYLMHVQELIPRSSEWPVCLSGRDPKGRE